MDKMEEIIECYINRVCMGEYVRCEVCGAWHDDGGMLEYNNKYVYVCFDCMERKNDGNCNRF